MPQSATAPAISKRRRLARRGVTLVTWSTLGLLLLGGVGHVVRDRSVLLALMMYVPLTPMGLWAVLLDLLRRGRSIPLGRFALSGAGVVAAVVGAVPMLPVRGPDAAPSSAPEVTLLHWNVMWGGRGRSPQNWNETADEIVRRAPDLVVLSEAPPEDWIFDALHRVGRGWRTVNITNEPNSRYWYNPVVCSRGPLKLERRVPVRNGAAMSVLAEVRGKTLRLLVVDGRSNPLLSRTPLLHDVAAACDEAARRGEPVDVIVGDFNAVGRSVGFDAVAVAATASLGTDGGYRRATDARRGWRATWPFPLPVFDIDHAWVRNGHAVTGCELFSSVRTDHRGQFVRIALGPQADGGRAGRPAHADLASGRSPAASSASAALASWGLAKR